MGDKTSTHCAICHAPTTNKCGGCKSESYCGRNCQMKGWATHKSICKDNQLEKTLARVADIVQKAYLNFRENTWDGLIIKVEDTDEALILLEGDILNTPGWFRPFPHDKMPANERTKNGVLTAWVCDEPYAFFYPLIQNLLHGLKVDIEELGVIPKNVPRKTVSICSNGIVQESSTGFQHTILRLTSRRSGTTWVFDICGAQFGIVKVLHAWPQYQEAFVKKVRQVFPAGILQRTVADLAVVEGISSVVYGVVGKVARVANEAVDAWEMKDMSLASLRALDDADYEPRKDNLLNAMHVTVRRYMQTNDFGPIVKAAKLYLSQHPGESEAKMKAIERHYAGFDLLRKQE